MPEIGNSLQDAQGLQDPDPASGEVSACAPVEQSASPNFAGRIAFPTATLLEHRVQVALQGTFFEIRLKAQGSRLKAQGSRLKAQGSRLKAQGSRLKAQGSRLKAQGSRLKAQAPWRLFRVPKNRAPLSAHHTVIPDTNPSTTSKAGSSQMWMNCQFVPAGRNPEQMASQLNCEPNIPRAPPFRG